MRCIEVQALITQYYSNELDEYTKIRIHHHLSKCPDCTDMYAMWKRGEDYLSLPVKDSPDPSSLPSSKMLSNVMGRIQQEEKWANPVVTRQSSSGNKTKIIFSFFISMLFILVLLGSMTLMIPDQIEPTHNVAQTSMMEGFDFNHIVLEKKEKTSQEQTSMDFKVVASIDNALVYSLPEENSMPPIGLVLSIFGILCVILGMSWITRV